MQELGHESLATTQRYLAEVRKPGEAKKHCAVHNPRDSVDKSNIIDVRSRERVALAQ
jgi:hypothetical protein